MALYTYDEDADVLYVLLAEESEASIERTEEVSPNLHVDIDQHGNVVGVEFLYARSAGVDLTPLKERAVDLRLPFTFAA